MGTSFQTKVPLFCFQAEFQRLALGFKCDMFTLEKRLRLEERSRDLAEENVRKEVSSCQGLLQVCVCAAVERTLFFFFFFFVIKVPLVAVITL